MRSDDTRVDAGAQGEESGLIATKGYQHGFFSRFRDDFTDFDTRERKARTMLAVLRDHLGDRLPLCHVLNVGTSTGALDNFLADHVKSVCGIDIDAEAIALAQSRFAKPNLRYTTGDAMNLIAENSSVDVVVCTHVYEHVPDAARLMREIHRVLKPSGICYFAAANRFVFLEPHYRIPLLPIMPRPIADLLMRITGKGDAYYEELLSLRSLRSLTDQFAVIDYTHGLIKDPVRWATDYMLPPGSIKHLLARLTARLAYPLVPTYVWILKKEDGRSC